MILPFLWLCAKINYTVSHYMGGSMDTKNLVLSQEEAEQMQKEDMELVADLYGRDYVNKLIANAQSGSEVISDAMNKRMVQIRKSKKMSQIELAKKVGISVNSLRLYEAGKRSPTFATLQKIADALDVKLADIIEYGYQKYFESELLSPRASKSTQGNPFLYSRNHLEEIAKDYEFLNVEGQKVAAERVHELTEIPRYKRKSTPEE